MELTLLAVPEGRKIELYKKIISGSDFTLN